MVQIKDASISDIPVIQEIAEKTWWPTYSSILSKEQLRYMLDHIYSSEVLALAMETGAQRFIVLVEDGATIAFASFGIRQEDPGIAKLHKLYALPETQGRGFGKLMIDEVKNRLIQSNIRLLDLNVNRFNKAKAFYEKMGFVVVREEDVSIGPYWMNDYVMRLSF